MKRMTDKEYLKHGGGKCPYCRSKNIEGNGNMDIEGDTIVQEVVCNDCKTRWNDYYKLTGYATLVIVSGDETDQTIEEATNGKKAVARSRKAS